MKISEISVGEIFDSRGEPTIEVRLTRGDGRVFTAQIPSGKSRGSREAAVLPYARARAAVRNILAKRLRKKSFASLKTFDSLLVSLDGTRNKRRLGGNVMLGASIAYARALADLRNRELWGMLAAEFPDLRPGTRPPHIFSNLINGGAHARNNLDIQEYLVIAKPRRPVTETVRTLIGFYRRLETLLQKTKKLARVPVGDEGGFAIDFKNNHEPLQILERLIRREKLAGELSLGLDCAANSFRTRSGYRFEKTHLAPPALLAKYQSYLTNTPLLASLEDPFAEDDGESFAALRRTAPRTLVVGDDLTATHPVLITRFAERKAINGVIIKPNQIGTLSETMEEIRAAHRRGLRCIVSHRSGETDDPFLVHVAKAGGAYGVKIGAPARERISKFNELIRLYE